jgi:DDE family transposase
MELVRWDRWRAQLECQSPGHAGRRRKQQYSADPDHPSTHPGQAPSPDHQSGARPAACAGRPRRPVLAAVPASQSPPSAEGGKALGYHADKRIRGRKRHLLVETGGLLLRNVVHSASVQDRAGAKLVLASLHARFPRVELVWADGGYANVVDTGLIDWLGFAQRLPDWEFDRRLLTQPI